MESYAESWGVHIQTTEDASNWGAARCTERLVGLVRSLQKYGVTVIDKVAHM